MTADQQRHHDDLREMARRYQWLRAAFVLQQQHLVDAVQAATRDIEDIDAQILRLLEAQRDLAAEVEAAP